MGSEMCIRDRLNGVPGQLVNIRSAEENQFVQNLADGITNRVLIGGTDAGNEGTWNWVENNAEADTFFTAGAPVAGIFTNFQPGNPSGSGEDALELITANGRWNDTSVNNTNNAGFVTEWDAADVLNVTCLLYTSPSPRDGLLSRMPSSA